MNQNTFTRIVVALALIGLAGVIISLSLAGAAGAFWPAAGLLVTALAAFGLQAAGRLRLAAYGLVLALAVLALAMFAPTHAAAYFTPYLFIPVVIIAGMILTPWAPVAVAALLILGALAILAVTRQITPATLKLLFPPFGLTVVAALLAAEVGRYTGSLRRLSVEKSHLLAQHIQKTESALQQARDLQQRTRTLEQQLAVSRGQASQTSNHTAQKDKLFNLVSGAVQELNVTIIGLEHILEEIDDLPRPADRGNLLEDAWQKIYHLTNLVISLEELARLETEKVPLNYQEVDLAGLLTETIGIAQGLARDKAISVRGQVPPNLPPVSADPNRLRQALLRLLSSAVKHTEAGIIQIDARAEDREMVITITATGLGATPNATEVILAQPGDVTPTRHGAGLGLAISKQIIEMHGGRVRVQSSLADGSTFLLTIPRTPPTRRPAAAGPAAVDATAVSVRLPLQPAPEETPTLLSQHPRIETRRNLGPVARFGPTYTGRFGLALLAMLVVVSVLVAFLAFSSRSAAPDMAAELSPAVSMAMTQPSPTQTPMAVPSPTAAAVLIEPSPTPSPPPTASPSPTTAATNTPSVTATPPPATSTATPPPTATPASTQTPLPTPTAAPPPAATPAALLAPVTAIPQSDWLSYTVTGPDKAAIMLQSTGRPQAELTLPPVAANHNRAVWSAAAGQLLLTRNGGANMDIYAVNAAGNGLTQLTADPADDMQPAWSPDGRRIAFSSGRTGNFEIYTMEANGQNPVQLTNSRGFDEWPVWSPNGLQIAFVSDRDGNEEIYVMNANGSGLQQLTNHPADDWPAAWAPDSRRLVFASNRDGNWNLYLINANGSGLQRLTNHPANEREPVWSPDGRTIAFAFDGGGQWDIYSLPALSIGTTEVAPAAWSQLTKTPADERYPAWKQ